MNPDPALIEGIQQKSEAALSQLYRETAHVIRSYVSRLVRDTFLTEEVVQDTFFQVWRSAASYRQERCSVMGWLLMIARTRAIDRLRVTRRQFEDHQHWPIQPYPNIEHDVMRRGTASTLSACVQRLPEMSRELIGLAFYQDFSHSEIARMTGLPLGTVKTKVRSALTEMRLMLAGERNQAAS